MIRNIFKSFSVFNSLPLLVIAMLFIPGNAALANIIEPDSQAKQANMVASPAILETREILDRASFIAFEGASAVQKLQTLSVDNATSEMLKNYMASMIYIPQAMALPTDAEALDEPWMASASGTTNEDGMVVPHLDDGDEPVDAKGMEIDTPATRAAKTFMKLLKPVQNAMITSPFGFRWGRPHQGIDMAAPVGTPIMSAEQGKVVYSGWKQGYGNFVAIDHGHGYTTHYAHCSKVLVHSGQAVKKGQLIAKVGNTGHSTGPHLHFEVVANGIHRNPAKFLNQTLTVVKAD
ncbi:MAG: family metallopeptidase [Vampirovibrio sp.]|jgi:murein DD-endopeptidase MepM/ murein hydrolase activator NlpD|nr:family metallopeptidase [Vampirovibrio sp.]